MQVLCYGLMTRISRTDLNLPWNVVPARNTTPQPRAHDTTLEVLYPWHPWFGEQVVVHQVIDRRDRAVFRCRLVSNLAAKPREVPQWMFDPAACCLIQTGEQPRVSVTGLQQLVQLLRQCVLQDQHFPLMEGDADEPRTPAPNGAIASGPVHASSRRASVEPSASDGTTDDQDAPGHIDPPARRPAPQRKGGRR